MVEREYFALAEVIEQGYISIFDILYLVENKILRTKIRLFNEVGRICEERISNGMPYSVPVKEVEMSGLYEVPLSEIRSIIKDGYIEIIKLYLQEQSSEYIELFSPVRIDFYELVITKAEKINLEKMCDFELPNTFRSKSSNIEIKDLPDGYTSVFYKGNEYKFGRIQASIVKQLYEAHKTGKEWIYGKTLMANAGSTSNRLGEIFKRHDQWRELIIGNKQGLYRLNV